MSQSLKSLVKPLVPVWALNKWRQRLYEAEQARYKNLPLNQVFEEIYETHTWDQKGSTARYRSGPGSSALVTKSYEAFVVDYLMHHPEARTLVDIGCGDFQVGHRILDALATLERPIRYIGCDIASNVIDYNSRTFGAPNVSFQVLDATNGSPPAGDIVTVREVFQHLSNAHICTAIANLRQHFGHAIITESIPPNPRAPNVDIVSGYRTRDGYGSGVFVDKPPFNLTVLNELVTVVSPTHEIRTTLVRL